MDIIVIKRDGCKIPYQSEKIINAVSKAYKDVYDIKSNNLGKVIENRIHEKLSYEKITEITVEDL